MPSRAPTSPDDDTLPATPRAPVRAARLLRLPPALILLAAGLSKLTDPSAFQLAVFEYKIVGFGLSGLAAAYLPALEAVTGFALLFRIAPLGAAASACGHYLLFTGALSYAILKGTAVECGCFGILSLPPPAALALDLALLACAAAALIIEIRSISPPRLPGIRPETA